MIRYEGTAINQFDSKASGNAANTTTVTVRDNTTGAKVAIYSDDGVTSKTNPFTVDSSGGYFFFVADGIYRIVLNEGLFNEKTISDVEIFSGLRKQRELMLYVTDFGAFNDVSGTVDQTAYFEAAAQAAGNDVLVYVPTGFYVLNSATTTAANWVLAQDAQISGLGGVSPTFERDTSRLTGKTLQLKSVNSWNAVRVGDPKYTVQKLTKKSFSAEIEGHSKFAAGGLLGTTYASARTTIDSSRHAVCGVAVNDVNDLTGVWAGYLEAYILDGTDGNSFCLESTTFNANSTISVDDTPNRTVVGRSGLTYNLWLTTGGDSAFAEPMYDTTAAIGILGKAGTWGAKYKRGIVCKAGSIDTDDFIAVPIGHKYSWWADKGSGDVRRAYVDGDAPLTTGRVRLGVWDGSANVEWQVSPTSAGFTVDNIGALGSASTRYTEVFAATGTINTSDAREKEQTRDLSATEKLVANEIKSNIKMFKWSDAVSAKGENARWHCGVMAQTVKTIFESHGLDGFDYGILCYDEWTADGVEVMESGNRYGIRYDELTMFMLGAL